MGYSSSTAHEPWLKWKIWAMRTAPIRCWCEWTFDVTFAFLFSICSTCVSLMIRSVYRSSALLEELGAAGNRLSGNNQSCRSDVLRATWTTAHELNRTSRPSYTTVHWSASRLYFVLSGCSETRTASDRFANCSQSTSWPIARRVTGSTWCRSVRFGSVRLL